MDWDAFFAVPAHRVMTARQVAEITGRSRSTVWDAIAVRAVRLPRDGGPNDGRSRQGIVESYDWVTFFAEPGNRTLSLKDVMAITGRSSGTVRKAADRAGVKLPRMSDKCQGQEPAQFGACGDSARYACELTPQQRMLLTSGVLTAGELEVIRRHRPLIARELRL